MAGRWDLIVQCTSAVLTQSTATKSLRLGSMALDRFYVGCESYKYFLSKKATLIDKQTSSSITTTLHYFCSVACLQYVLVNDVPGMLVEWEIQQDRWL
jgi:hypothetical protein